MASLVGNGALISGPGPGPREATGVIALTENTHGCLLPGTQAPQPADLSIHEPWAKSCLPGWHVGTQGLSLTPPLIAVVQLTYSLWNSVTCIQGHLGLRVTQAQMSHPWDRVDVCKMQVCPKGWVPRRYWLMADLLPLFPGTTWRQEGPK